MSILHIIRERELTGTRLNSSFCSGCRRSTSFIDSMRGTSSTSFLLHFSTLFIDEHLWPPENCDWVAWDVTGCPEPKWYCKFSNNAYFLWHFFALELGVSKNYGAALSFPTQPPSAHIYIYVLLYPCFFLLLFLQLSHSFFIQFFPHFFTDLNTESNLECVGSGCIAFLWKEEVLAFLLFNLGKFRSVLVFATVSNRSLSLEATSKFCILKFSLAVFQLINYSVFL